MPSACPFVSASLRRPWASGAVESVGDLGVASESGSGVVPGGDGAGCVPEPGSGIHQHCREWVVEHAPCRRMPPHSVGMQVGTAAHSFEQIRGWFHPLPA